MKKLIVIGGGPAGMMAAATAVSTMESCSVTLFEKNGILGKKLFITGKGRCNVTNDAPPDELIENVVSNPYFMYSSFYSFGSDKTKEFFECHGVPLKTERGNRVFPRSDKSGDIVKAMVKALEPSVKVKLNNPVKEILTENGKVKGVLADKVYEADVVILATGGLSYPATGSTGDGFKFARATGHTVTKLRPSLVPLHTEEAWVKDLQGLSLKNVQITVRATEKEKTGGKVLYKDFGEMLFTHYGVSGPVVLSASAHLLDSLDQPGLKLTLSIDLKPALSEKELDTRVLRDFSKYINKDFKNALDELLPQKLIPVMIQCCGIPPDKKVNEITQGERSSLVKILKSFDLTLSKASGYDESVITRGGVSVDMVDPSTMESKLIQNLYFAGEILDVDALTGGYNLQIAFSTGHLAGKSAVIR